MNTYTIEADSSENAYCVFRGSVQITPVYARRAIAERECALAEQHNYRLRRDGESIHAEWQWDAQSAWIHMFMVSKNAYAIFTGMVQAKAYMTRWCITDYVVFESEKRT